MTTKGKTAVSTALDGARNEGAKATAGLAATLRARKPRAKPKTIVVKAPPEPKKRTGERKESTPDRLRALVAGATLEIRKSDERTVSNMLSNLKRRGDLKGRFVVRSTTRGVAVWRVE